MEKSKQNTTEQIIYNVNDEPIVLSKALLDLFLKQKHPADLIALYTFYYYTAKWQGTNRPWASDEYCLKGLKWGEDRLRSAKKQLISLKLIEVIRGTGNDGKISKWFIKIQFMWKTDTLIQNPQNTPLVNEKPQPLKTSTGFQRTNALSSNNGNALSSNIIVRTKKPGKISPKEIKNKKYLPFAEKLSEIIQTQKQYKHTLPQIKSWANEFRRLEEDHGVSFERIGDVLLWYAKNIGGAFVPVVESGSSFRQKFEKLEAAIERSKTNYHKPINGNGTRAFGIKSNYREADVVYSNN